MAGSVMVAAETLQRLSWGLPGASMGFPSRILVWLLALCLNTGVEGMLVEDRLVRPPRPLLPPLPSVGAARTRTRGWGTAGKG